MCNFGKWSATYRLISGLKSNHFIELCSEFSLALEFALQLLIKPGTSPESYIEFDIEPFFEIGLAEGCGGWLQRLGCGSCLRF